ncbi:MAG: UPF0164 family protein [Spirochaetes bacterium]|nr:UPF0164 family protein [Spirochaetota bacterium]
MKKYLLLVILLFFPLILFSQTDFENNFLNGLLKFESFWSDLSGDYGTTFFPSLNEGYGGRQSAFAQAFTAVADDITTIEANPAGTASLKYTEVFFSHHKLIADVNYNTAAFAIRFNNLAFALGTRILYLPFTHYDNFGDVVSSGMISYTVITLNAAYNFLPSYKFFGFSVGGNVKLYIYHVPEKIAADQTKVNVAFDLGVLTRFNFLKAYHYDEKNFSVGLAVKNLGPFTDGEPPPTTISLGLAYKPIYRLLFSLDGNMLINYTTDTYKNWFISTGFEVYYTKFTSLIMGVKISSSPALSVGLHFNFDSFTITANYNWGLDDYSKFNVSASLKLGDFGRQRRKEELRKKLANAQRLISLNQYEAAKVLLEEILKVQPRHEIARGNLKYVNNFIILMQEYDAIIDNENVLE